MPLPICPNCHIGTQEVARDGVQIDICPSCRGVWLDRGELEKLLNGVRRAEAEWERDQATYPNPPQAQVDG
ncbi:MAG TPA: zf-TFIIB domain-containing protein, partial [Alphaproteobacteria bacterium]|nr:zf-TFIIB domain-containing protein [Alphaproteobacteria bacterium]